MDRHKSHSFFAKVKAQITSEESVLYDDKWLRLYGWLDAFLARVRGARADEAAAVRARQLLGAAVETLSVGVPVLVLAAAFGGRAALNPAPLAAADAS